MATKKQYGYYMEGNRIGLAQRESDTTSTDLRSEDYGKYKSPTESVSQGLEIKYTYIPEYNIKSGGQFGDNKFILGGWTVINDYLAFFSNGSTGVINWTSATGNYSNVAANEHILIQGSSRWNGVHKVQTAASNGLITTYTKVDTAMIQFYELNGMDITTQGSGTTLPKVNVNNASYEFWKGNLEAGDYIYMYGWVAGTNNGLFEVDSLFGVDEASEANRGIYLKARYITSQSGASPSGFTQTDNYGELYKDDLTLTTITTETDVSAYIYKAYKDNCTLTTDIEKMEDESFELDVPRYLNNAIVYYLKAKMAEDMRDFETMQFYMREFKRQVEKQGSSRVTTTYRIQGFNHMRNK